MDTEFITRLDTARELAGIPFKVTSGRRCSAHNAVVGGVPQSLHLDGRAADIAVPSAEIRFFLIQAALNAGFVQLGLGKDYVHFQLGLGGLKLWLA